MGVLPHRFLAYPSLLRACVVVLEEGEVDGKRVRSKRTKVFWRVRGGVGGQVGPSRSSTTTTTMESSSSRRAGQWQEGAGGGGRFMVSHHVGSDRFANSVAIDVNGRGKKGVADAGGPSSCVTVSNHAHSVSESMALPNNLISLPPPPTNPLVTPLLTDMYQITMAYAYWKSGKAEDHAVFDLLHRKNPFNGEFTVFAGLEECIRFVANFKFRDDEIEYLKTVLPSSTELEFFEFLKQVDCSGISMHAIPEGSVVFPRVPLMRVEGPLLVAQLLETTLLNLVNYASLVATNAVRHRLVAGEDKLLLEFGLRRAQGPDGGLSASRYSYLGGFDGTSNVEAGKLFGIPVRGTHAHAFVSSFLSFSDLPTTALRKSDGVGVCEDFVGLAQQWLGKLQAIEALREHFVETNESELVAFVAYALAFPTGFMALVDTYDVLRSGIPNFCAVALSLIDCGYKPLGIRLDSGDLAYQSLEARRFFKVVGEAFNVPSFQEMKITASNDINEETLDALNKQGHSIDAFGIGTHLVTCFKQPALGCVYKLVEINGQPRIKISADPTKVTIPGKKWGYRIYGKEGYALLDLLVAETDSPPKIGQRILCRHPFSEAKRAYVVPQRVEPLYKTYWLGKAGGQCFPSGAEFQAGSISLSVIK